MKEENKIEIDDVVCGLSLELEQLKALQTLTVKGFEAVRLYDDDSRKAFDIINYCSHLVLEKLTEICKSADELTGMNIVLAEPKGD